MIDFEPTEEMKLLRQTVRGFVSTRLQPLEAEVEEKGHIPAETLAALKREARALGLFAMNMPEEVGGGGLSTVAMAVVEEELGKTSDALIRRSVGQVYEMLLACKGAQRERYLLPTVRGEKICCMAITEPGAGSDAASIATTARRDGDHYVLEGSKHFISDGTLCDYAIVMALTDREKRARGGITLFLVDKGTAGFTATRVQRMMGHRGYDHSELAFEGCRVPASNILGELGQGFKLIMSTVNRIRLLHIGARSVGMATRLLEMCAAHARDRVQFGKPIGEYQMVQQMLADMAIKVHAARMMVLNAAWEIDQERDPRDKVSMIKVFAAEMLGEVADKAVQIHGGSGFCKDLPVERIYRDCRVLRIYDGTSEIHRMLIAKSLLKNGISH
jgi:acyl-CoA dehydrogenase